MLCTKELPASDYEFYPTPEELIAKMAQKSMVYTDGDGKERKREISSVLEPSAGKGNLVEGLSIRLNRHYINGVSIDCIERDQNLRLILKDKINNLKTDARIVHDDFLSFMTWKHYDLMLMNPPFSNGDEHLLKAISLAEQNGGGVIVCLLNAETIRNPYTNRRKELLKKLDLYDSEVEFCENAFLQAERTASVDVAIICCEIKKKPLVRDFLSELQKAQEEADEQEEIGKKICPADPIERSIALYNYEISETLKLVKEYKKIESAIDSSFDHKYSNPILELKCGERNFDRNHYLKRIRQKYWKQFFENPQFTGMLTTNLQSEFLSMVNDMKDYKIPAGKPTVLTVG